MKYEINISFFPHLSCDKTTENRDKALNSLKSLNNVYNTTLSEDKEVIDNITKIANSSGASVVCVEHERKGNKVYSFERVG